LRAKAGIASNPLTYTIADSHAYSYACNDACPVADVLRELTCYVTTSGNYTPAYIACPSAANHPTGPPTRDARLVHFLGPMHTLLVFVLAVIFIRYRNMFVRLSVQNHESSRYNIVATL
jgi:hypothetical protein